MYIIISGREEWLLERFAMSRLIEWKQKKRRKPLIIRGARQVGKTWLMKEFGRTCFSSVAYINFDNNPGMEQVFSGDISPERILTAIRIQTGMAIEPETTLIIFDEIQEVPRALTSLKYFCEEAPEYAVIAAGSLLGVALHRGTSFPVGKVDFMDLYPLSYREFLTAIGERKLSELLSGMDTDMITVFKEKYIDYLREYYYIGGMPEAVQTYLDTKDFLQVREIQNNLLTYYQQDFSKHASASLVPRLNLVWSSIPSQLAKENRKFIYGQVRKGARAKDFELAIQWLSDCGLIHKVQRVKKPGLPLKAYADLDAFKLYMADIGLMTAMTGLNVRILLEGNRIFTEFKGALTEQYVLQQLIAELDIEPFYYSTENSSGEIDFLLQGETDILPLEVKAEENLKARSLRAFCDKYHPANAIRTSMSDYREQDWMTNIPLYNIGRIGSYLEE